MISLKKLLYTLAETGESISDDALASLKARFERIPRPAEIVPFLGYGTSNRLYLRGRVLRDVEYTSEEATDSIWENVIRTYQRINSQELPGEPILITHNRRGWVVTSDEEGYFKIEGQVAQFDEKEQRVDIQLKLLNYSDTTITAEVIIPHPEASFGIISDIDDTILESRATSYPEAAYLMFTKNVQTRTPFPGVAEFYQSLRQDQKNPIFYVSSSPWNLYEFLIDFMELQNIPVGPLFLKDYGISDTQLISAGHRAHKVNQITTILEAYPDLPFILIGDSGQKDPEIYAEMFERHPDRIQAIFLRDVSSEGRDEEVAKLLEALPVPTFFAADSDSAAEYARSIGLIP